MDTSSRGASDTEIFDVAIGDRVGRIAAMRPNTPAIIAVAPNGTETRCTWTELDHRSTQCASVLARHGVSAGDLVVVALPSTADHAVAALGAWKRGATVLPLDPRLPPAEFKRLIAATHPSVCVGVSGEDIECPRVNVDEWRDAETTISSQSDGARLVPRSAAATSGSTGRPRVILNRRAWVFDERELPSAHERSIGLEIGQVQLVVLPLSHGGFGALHRGLVLAHTIVLIPTFIPRLVATSIENYGINVMRLVPTMMKLLLLPDVGLGDSDLSSIAALHHGTAPCPAGVKEAWMDLLGPEKVYESYASQEQLGFVYIRGDEWLRHPGSVGRPGADMLVIVGEDDARVPANQIGRIFIRPPDGSHPEYLGAGQRLAEWGEGYFSVGDLGYLDEDGYLFVTSRSDDCINVGGANVYPAELEAVLAASDDVVDSLVIARPHPVLGQVPHAVVVARDPDSPDLADRLTSHCRRNLPSHKVPASFEFVQSIPRNENGKVTLAARAAANWAGPGA